MRRTHGLEGEVVVVPRYEWLSAVFEPGVWVFVLHDRKPVPYRVDRIRWAPGRGILRLEEVTAIEHAEKLAGASVVWPRAWIQRRFPDRLLPEWLEGRDVVINGQVEGVIRKVEELPSQWLLTVDVAGREILMPLEEEKRKGILFERPIQISVPDGLLEGL